MSEEQRQLEEHSSSIFELQKVLEVHSGSAPRGTSTPKGVRVNGEGGVGDAEDSYDYVIEMITDVRSEHGVKIDDINDKVGIVCMVSIRIGKRSL